mgnify:CR=1 FL=1
MLAFTQRLTVALERELEERTLDALDDRTELEERAELDDRTDEDDRDDVTAQYCW